ncbi:Tat pathway signal sequence domain protein [Streptomyces abyssalis]|uniref:Tat pathway signal sequence domain protein n=1 Tax=Streptomyces abyssalis TaxID=933944 RepID=A0A1E7JJI5_9ACTN|nr:DUF4429 domain-containing protein [Streptomyces abyssalis]OEU87272.1 Tat pathway signal sequence domain protein [Streptomyces abyssalis]OEU87804.1 Tat pathway signal sequence domain protein [Streptomyces abyssalis]OEV30373.1 Tat pathway signal sequence domain protein [Streptomyces nanshensis]
MAEIIQRTGTWTFDGETIRIVPAAGKQVPPLRKSLGEVAVPLMAVSGIAYEPGRKGGRLRLRLREGADPLAQVASGRLPDGSDPYQLAVERDREGVAEYFVEELRRALLLDEVPDTPCDRYLLPGPSVPLTASGTDGTVSFDGERIQLDWNWMAAESKSHAGPRLLALDELDGVEWTPAIGWENGSLRFRPKGRPPVLKPEHDPNCLLLWGIRQARETGGSVLLAAAVTARLPHPAAAQPHQGGGPAVPPAAPSLSKGGGTAAYAPGAAGTDGTADVSDHDGLLRRLRELGELHREGVLTDEEFTTAKKALLDRF